VDTAASAEEGADDDAEDSLEVAQAECRKLLLDVKHYIQEHAQAPTPRAGLGAPRDLLQEVPQAYGYTDCATGRGFRRPH
jgi:hypothetical protein